MFVCWILNLSSRDEDTQKPDGPSHIMSWLKEITELNGGKKKLVRAFSTILSAPRRCIMYESSPLYPSLTTARSNYRDIYFS